MLAETIDKHVYKYFTAGKNFELLGKRLLHNDELLAPIASFAQTRTLDAIGGKRRVGVFEPTSMTADAKKDKSMAEEATVMSEAPARTSPKSSAQESYKRCRSLRTLHWTWSPIVEAEATKQAHRTQQCR